MATIKKIFARQVIDSRGNPTVEAEVTLESGVMAQAIVPSGASTGTKEALELRDGGKAWGGKAVTKAVSNVNNIIASKIIGMDATQQEVIDKTMLKIDGTDNKQKLGANAILAVSMAVAKVAAKELKIPLWKHFQNLSKTNHISLPCPMLNVLNGGEHADNSVDFQEYMIFPLGAKSFSEAMQMASETFHNLAKLLSSADHTTAVGDEGGFAPNLSSNEEALQFIVKAIEKAGYKPGKDIYIAMDVAASEFYDQKTKRYILKGENKTLTTEELVEYYVQLCQKYPIVSIEDGLSEHDWSGFKLMTDKLKDKISIVGDDLFVTNKKILKEGIEKGVANSILIKVNQIGSITETIETMHLAKENGYTCIVSHRSGESEDTTIADFAVGLNSQQIKTGSMSRTDRIAKYNQLLRIEEIVKTYPGKKALWNLKII